MGIAAPDAAVDETKLVHELRLVDVAPIQQNRQTHELAQAFQVELLELVPLRHHHQGIASLRIW
jgi:hypothetical protein